MGSAIGRQLQALADLPGFEDSNNFDSGATMPQSTSLSRPSTPAPIHKTRVLPFDPRSPTANITRTPIEVLSTPKSQTEKVAQDSPMTAVLKSRQNCLETDLDSLSTHELEVNTPESKPEMPLPPGLSHAHVLKLRFLGLDPRSPSLNVVRTPIQVKTSVTSPDESNFSFASVSNSSSSVIQDLSFTGSMNSFDLTRDFSDPSPIVSDDDENEGDFIVVPNVAEEVTEQIIEQNIRSPPVEVAPISKASKAKVTVFCEEESDVTQKNAQTPEVVTKITRTPLTPICNTALTPSKVVRVRQTQSAKKDQPTKVKIYNGELPKTPIRPIPSKQVSATRNQSVRNSPVKSGRKKTILNDENSGLNVEEKPVVAQWDHENTLFI